MTHTKSELKKAIAMCSRDIGNAECKLCPYDIGCDRCFVELNRDALEYIMELEAEKPKGAWLMVYEEGECICFRSGGENGECDPRIMALAMLNRAVAIYRDELDTEAYAQLLAETKNALADGSPFWADLEPKEEGQCRE